MEEEPVDLSSVTPQTVQANMASEPDLTRPKGRVRLRAKNKTTETDVLKSAFVAELMQIPLVETDRSKGDAAGADTPVPSQDDEAMADKAKRDKALSLVDQGITLRDIKSRRPRDLAGRRYGLVADLVADWTCDDGAVAQAIGDTLGEPHLARSLQQEEFFGVPGDKRRDTEAFAKDWLTEDFQRLNTEVHKRELKELGVLEALDVSEEEVKQLVDLGITRHEIRFRPERELTELLLTFRAVRDRLAPVENLREADLGAWDADSESGSKEQVGEILDSGVDGPALLEAWDAAQKQELDDRQMDQWRVLLPEAIVLEQVRKWKRKIERAERLIPSSPEDGGNLCTVQFHDLLTVSDFHMAAGNYPTADNLARLSPTEDFYFDGAFFRFLHYCEEERRERQGYAYELVFNGDMVDFVQVVVPGDEEGIPSWALPPLWLANGDGGDGGSGRSTQSPKDLYDGAKETQKPLARTIEPIIEEQGRFAKSVVDSAAAQKQTQRRASRTANPAEAVVAIAARDLGGREAREILYRARHTLTPEEWAADAWTRQAIRSRTERRIVNQKVRELTRKEALGQLAEVYYGHRSLFQGLAWFLAQGNRLIVIRGNHDPQWYWPEVQRAFVGWLKAAYDELRRTCKTPAGFELPVRAGTLTRHLPNQELPDVSLAYFEEQVRFDYDWFYYRDRLAYIEHGGQYDAVNSYRYFLAPTDDGEQEICSCLGNVAMPLKNVAEIELPNFDRPGYMKVYIDWLKYNLPWAFVASLLKSLFLTIGRVWHWIWHQPGPKIRREHENARREHAVRTNLPSSCVQALDETRWVGRWRELKWGWEVFVERFLPPIAGIVIALSVAVLLLVWFGMRPEESPSGDQLVYMSWIDTILGWLSSGIISLGFGFLGYWAVKVIAGWIGLGLDYLYKPAVSVEGILQEHDRGVPYILFGHDHIRNSQRLPGGGWYLNTGAWTHEYRIERKRLLREPLEYSFVRMIDTHRVLAADWGDSPPEEPDVTVGVESDETFLVQSGGATPLGSHVGPKVELLRWNDEGFRVEECETFRAKDESRMADEHELIKMYEPVLRFSRFGKDKVKEGKEVAGENFFPMAARHYVHDCGLRHRGKGWIHEPPSGSLPGTLLHHLGTVPKPDECYLAYAVVKPDSPEIGLLDQGFALSKLPKDAEFESDLRPEELMPRMWVKPGESEAIVKELKKENNVEVVEKNLTTEQRKKVYGRTQDSDAGTSRVQGQTEERKLLMLAEPATAIHRRGWALAKYRERYSDWEKHPPVYHYHVCKDGRYTVLQYWFLYAYNDWGSHGGFNDHEGDWEVVFVFLDEKRAPKHVVSSKHVYIPKVCEPDRCTWKDVEKVEGTHPVVYVGCGSHAGYLTKGKDRFFGYDDHHHGNDEGKDIGPGTGRPWGPPVRLANKPWNTRFSGRWGALVDVWGLFVVPGTEGPTGPAQKGKKWHHPAQWANVRGKYRFGTEE